MATPETPAHAPSLADELAAAMAWWEEAGVTDDFTDDVTDWLANDVAEPVEEKSSPKPKSAPPVRQSAIERMQAENTLQPVGGDPGAWPDTLSAFAEWWVTEPTLALAGSAPPVPPRGPPGAELMVLVPEPEAVDAQRLLSGEDGKMLDAVLSAIRIDPAHVYFASALPSVVPAVDWSAMQAAGLDKIIDLHVRLAAPKRLIIMGSSILPLFGHDTAQGGAGLLQINQDGRNVPVMAARTIANLRNLPGERARFWRRWLQWMDS